MAFRRPLYLLTDTTVVPNQTNIAEYADDYITDIREFSGWVHSQQPSTQLVTTGGSGTLLSNQAFTDTYYIAGSYTTRVDRYSTAAETPNVSMSTDTYSRIRQINNTGTQPTGDTNNHQFPLYRDSQNRLRSMTRQDFIDTFVTPSITIITNGGTGLGQGGTYFMTTSSTPTGGTIVSSTPAAVNSVSNLSAYTAGGIAEARKQTTDTNYYIARVEYSDDDYLPIADALPIYFNAGDENVYAHSPESWRDLIGPYLRYFIGSDPQYQINYNINGSGSNRGTSFTDSRRTPTGTGYTTRFVNANDYRTQEFPTGTESTVSGSTKTLKMTIGTSGATYAASANPAGPVNEGTSVTFTMTTTNVANGSTLAFTITGIDSADISAGSLSGNITINSNTGSTSVTLANDATTEGTETMVFTCAGQTVSVQITDSSTTPAPSSFEQIRLEGTSGAPELNNGLFTSDGSMEVGWRFETDGVVNDWNADRSPTTDTSGHLTWCTVTNPIRTYYIRIDTPASVVSGQSFTSNCQSVWVALTTDRFMYFLDNRTANSYGPALYTFTVKISASSTGGNWTSTSTHDDTFGSEYQWTQEPFDASNTLYQIRWNGVLVQATTLGNSTTTSIVGNDGRTYTRGALFAVGDSGEPDAYYVSQTIDEVTGYYRVAYEGGA